MSFNLSPDITLTSAAKAVTHGEANLIANMANIAALIFEYIDRINWAGFYLYDKETDGLVLGPFQGKVACVRIPLGKGVCGTAAQTRETVVVPDVHVFPGHIACDAASLSEIVVPIICKNGELVGVLDIDSPILARFSDEDRAVFEELAEILITG
ncbi:MAG: GAF domain-containing protein [Defluviitaleaceae bacterium]|nr:GAF domain-containing protein [Defluviitaleaceae bacterium]